MPENIESSCLKKIIEALYQEQKSMWSSENKNFASQEATVLRANLLRQDWKEISDYELETLLKLPEFDFSPEKFVMFLPPFERETSSFLPVMSLKYLPTQNIFAIRIMMMTSASNKNPIPCQGVGFRIEAPHNNGAGRHRFYHAQLVNAFDYGPWKIGTAESINWLPLHQPSFPLWATNPIEAMLCLVLTLYGRVYYSRFYSAYSSRFNNAIQSEFKSLHSRLI